MADTLRAIISDSNFKRPHRHCEPTGRANARPMTGSAKQPMHPRESMDCVVALLLAMTNSKQAQLLPASLRLHEMVGGQFRAPLVQPELLAGDLEAAADHPGHRPGALHPRSPLRVVVAAATHVADQGEDVAIAV